MLACIDGVFTREEAAHWRRELAAAEWRDGASSAGAVARLVKHNAQLPDDSPLAASLGREILRRLSQHPLFVSAALPAKIHPPRFNRYGVGDAFGAHVDAALMGLPDGGALRSDLSATLFFSEPDDYDGGVLEMEGPFGAQAVKLEAGALVLYPSDSLHRVTPVTRGTRYAAFLWLQSHVRNSAARAALHDLDQCIQRLSVRVGAGDPEVLRLTHVYHNLLRLSADT